MKTVKLTISNHVDVFDDMRTYSSIVRIAFNRYQDGLDEKQIRAYCNMKFTCNRWFIQCAIKEAYSLYKLHGNRRILFGGKNNFRQYMRGLIDKNVFKYRRLFPICIQGQAAAKGNRLFGFDLNNHQILYKPNRSKHTLIEFFPMRKRIAAELMKVQELIEQNSLTVTVKLSDKYVWLTYDESQLYTCRYVNLISNRVLGIDMNPNYIGLSVIEFNQSDNFTILHKRVYDLSQLTKSSCKASASPLSKHITNKLKYETIMIAHDIAKLVNVWKCKTVAIENLNIKLNDQKKGKRLNRLCNNKWERCLFVNKLKMLSTLYKFDIIEVNPVYSSIVGNVAYGNANTPDMVAASIEIARRSYKKFEKGWFYPRFSIQNRDEQWKQTLGLVDAWKGLFLKIKETGLKYRFLLKDCLQNAVFSKNYKQKCYAIYEFA